MRLKKTEVLEREAFAREQFTKTPDLSIPKANQFIAARFGKAMNRNRLYVIREETRTTSTPETTL